MSNPSRTVSMPYYKVVTPPYVRVGIVVRAVSVGVVIRVRVRGARAVIAGTVVVALQHIS
jgi:hypothetical protein